MATLACNHEIPQDQGFLAFYKSLPEKTSTTVRFFERNEFYTVHGEDAIFVAKEVFKTLSVVKIYGSGGHKLESVSLSKLAFDSLLRDLLFARKYRIEIYKSKGSSKTQEWRLESKASPGNLTQIEDLLFGDESHGFVDSKGVIAIKVKPVNKQMNIGIAFADAILREIKIAEFVDNSSFTELEAFIVQLSPKECLLSPFNDADANKELNRVFHRNNLAVVDCKATDFHPPDVQDLERLLHSEYENKLPSFILSDTDEMKVALQCTSAVITYLELLSDESNFGEFKISSFNPKLYMRLDGSATRALGLFPNSSEDSKSQSLYGLLNKCRTTQGQRLLSKWIKQPLMDVKSIEQRLDLVEIFVSDTELRHSLFENHLRKFPDLQLLSRKFQRRKADIQDIYKVYVMLAQLPALLDCLSKHTGPYSYVLKLAFCSDLHERMTEFEPFRQMVFSVLDLEAVEAGEFMMKPGCDPNLKRLKDLMDMDQIKILEETEKVAEDLGLEAKKSLKLENCPQIGYHFRVTRKDEKILRTKTGYTTIDAKQNGVRFYNCYLKELNDHFVKLRKSYEKCQHTLVNQVVNVAATYCSCMKQLGEIIAQLDVLVAFAITSVDAPKPYVRPMILEKGLLGIVMKQVRHPCLEVQPNTDFIPNDIHLERDKQLFHLITGPNMGGKSTYIRSVALNVLMAQIGCFIPCNKAQISIVDAILTRVGANDKPTKGLSTFMAEMLEMNHILETATADSLIIVDELGRGTSTYDGLGLAWAFSEYIACSLQSYCLFTTHFHELSGLSKIIKSIINLHVTAVTVEGDITFLYKLEPGVCDQSFGIHVAEMTYFPKCVIDYAKHKLDELETSGFLKSVLCNGAKASASEESCDPTDSGMVFESLVRRAAEVSAVAEDACVAVKRLKTDFDASCSS